MKFVTFNLRADYGDGADGGNAFCCRQPLIAKVLQAEQPDFVGFQEVLPAAQRWLRAAMPGYTVLGCGRGADLAGEAMTIAVRDETLELLGWIHSGFRRRRRNPAAATGIKAIARAVAPSLFCGMRRAGCSAHTTPTLTT